MAGELTAWLRSLDVDALAEVLTLRPEACTAPVPASLEELAQRLAQRPSVFRALAEVDRGVLQLTEVLAATGPVTRPALAEMLGADIPAEAVDAGLAELRRRALVWQVPGSESGSAEISPAGAFSALWPRPLGLGERLRPLLGRLQGHQVDVIVRTLKVTHGGSRAKQHGAVVAHLTPDRIRALAAAAPTDAAALLEEATWDGPTFRLPPQDAYRLQSPGRYGEVSGLEWCLMHGLLLPKGWDVVEMPLEVGRALRGPGWHASVDLRRPTTTTAPADPAGVDRESSAAASSALEAVTAVLESVAATPAASLKGGGVGVREIRRLAKSVGHPEDLVVLALELGGAAGLLGASREPSHVFAAGPVLPSATYDEWRGGQPAQRLTTLLLAWWERRHAVTERTDDMTGKPMPALVPHPPARDDVLRLRQALLRGLVAMPAGRAVVDVTSFVEQVCWDRPLSYPSGAVLAEQAGAAWREAETLGLVAQGAATALGVALTRGDAEVLAEAAADLLPAATSTVTLQADLTAIVTGAPDAGLAELLDAAADREGRGGASVWRFSPRSARRYLDEGGDVEELLGRLAAVAPRGIPQPVEYLLRDVARRHGHVAVRPVACCIVSDDAALVAEIAATRSLARLGLRVLAPTVLASGKPVPETLDALRAAGYAPVRRTAEGELVVEKAERQRAKPRGPAEQPRSELRQWAEAHGFDTAGGRVRPERDSPDLAALAKSLLAASDEPDLDATVVRFPGATATLLDAFAGQLVAHEIALLAHAVDHDGAVEIAYLDSNGTYSERVVSELELDPPMLVTYCHLRQDERAFSLRRIQSVSPA